MTTERIVILKMLSDGKITVDEAERLLQLSGKAPGMPGSQSESSGAGSSTSRSGTRNPQYIRIIVEPGPDAVGKKAQQHVNVKVPLKIIRAGVNLASLIPGEAGETVQDKLDAKGFNLNISKLTGESLDELIEGLQDLSVDVDDPEHRVRVFIE